MSQAAAVPAREELVLGRYRPLQPLGSGGSGSVWLARDEETGAEVALKIVPREGNAHARAKREAAAAARLRHERCVRAYAFGADSEHVYIASEYVAGKTLRNALRAGELDDAGAIEAAAQILDGLAHAHEHGIVHRDVKPSNVLLADGPEVSVRLLDFGLALMHEAETLTAVGDVPGTLAYISPERLRGETAGPASDVWSVGVLLWEALAGRHPFWSGSLLETGRKIQAGAPSLGDVRPDLPQQLVAAVDRAPSRDPSRRPGAARLAAAFRAARRARQHAPAPEPARALSSPLAKLAPATLAAISAVWVASALPFYPDAWAPGIGVLAGLLTFVRPRAGLAFALAVPVFPLGNLALGAAILYGAIAVAWLVLFSRRPHEALLLVTGPLLALAGALALLPLAAQAVHGTARRYIQTAAGVLVAGLVCGIRDTPLPLTNTPPPDKLLLAGRESPFAVASELLYALTARPEIPLTALALGAAAALLPVAANRGHGAIAGWGVATLAVIVLPLPVASPLSVALPLAASCIAVVAAGRGQPSPGSAESNSTAENSALEPFSPAAETPGAR